MHPELIPRSCERCEKKMYDDRPGEMGPPIMLENGEQMDRPIGGTPPCYQCPKVPPSAPERTRQYAIDPTEKSRRALAHYQECRAVGRFPLDVIVERNAGLIAPVERAAQVAQARDAAGLIAMLLASGGKRA